MTTVTICSHKGGTGKTTTAINLAAALSLTGHKTLLIDIDPQGYLTSMLALEQGEYKGTSLELFEPNASLNNIQPSRVGSIDVLPSSSMFTSRMRRLNKATDVFWLKEALNTDSPYEFVFIDTAAAITVYSLNALVATDYTIIPVTPEYQPVVGAEQTAETVRVVKNKLNPNLNDPIFVLTQVDGRKRSHKRYKEYLKGKFGSQLMKTEIRTCTTLSNSYKGGVTVFDLDLQSRGAMDYARLTDALLKRFKAEGKPPLRRSQIA